MNKRILIANVLGLIIALFVAAEILRFLISDFVSSIIPGWHTTVYAKSKLLIGGTVLFLILCYLIWNIYRLITTLLLRVLNKK